MGKEKWGHPSFVEERRKEGDIYGRSSDVKPN
jgi:hypothetical protein